MRSRRPCLAERALALGYPWCEDHNAPTGTGVSPYAADARGGSRVTANDGYLRPPASDRSSGRGGRARRPCPVEGDRAVGVRARVGEGGSRCARRASSSARARFTLRRSCCGRASGLTGPSPASRRRRAPGPPLALFWPSPSRGATRLDARQTNCCLPVLLRPRRGAGKRHDDRRHQPDAVTHRPHRCTGGRHGRHVGRSRWQPQSASQACCSLGEPPVLPWPARPRLGRPGR